MCRLASFFFKPIEGVPVAVAVLDHHEATKEKLKLDADSGQNSWHEGHYEPNGAIECRCIAGDTKTAAECVAEIRAKWPTFISFFSWSIKEGATVSGWLDLSRLTSAKDLVLPKTVSGGLDLSGLTSAEREEIRKQYGM